MAEGKCPARSDLTMNRPAPAARAASRYWGRSWIVMMMTAGASHREAIHRAASRPSMSGMARSMRTRAGRRRSTASTAPWPEAASPTTSMPGSMPAGGRRTSAILSGRLPRSHARISSWASCLSGRVQLSANDHKSTTTLSPSGIHPRARSAFLPRWPIRRPGRPARRGWRSGPTPRCRGYPAAPSTGPGGCPPSWR
jgi:hypothetical protein